MAKKAKAAKRAAAKRAAGDFLLTTALVPASTLRNVIRGGVGAFENGDRALIANDQKQRIGDSINLDLALRDQFPQANRWDYIFSLSDTRKVLALEPHTAADSEVKTVIAKKRNAADYLRGHLHPQHFVAAWLWVSSGKSTLTKTEKYEKQLAAAGIRYVGRYISNLV